MLQGRALYQAIMLNGQTDGCTKLSQRVRSVYKGHMLPGKLFIGQSTSEQYVQYVLDLHPLQQSSLPNEEERRVCR